MRTCFINPRHTCATRVTVLVLRVCVCVCVCVCAQQKREGYFNLAKVISVAAE